MRRIGIYLAAVLIVVLLAGMGYLAFVDVPMHTTNVEKILPDGRFPK